jgi:hypothetical protein
MLGNIRRRLYNEDVSSTIGGYAQTAVKLRLFPTQWYPYGILVLAQNIHN